MPLEAQFAPSPVFDWLDGRVQPSGVMNYDQDGVTIRHCRRSHTKDGASAFWDSETEAVSEKLRELGGTPQTHEVAKLTAEVG